jgi:hypothetical protein
MRVTDGNYTLPGCNTNLTTFPGQLNSTACSAASSSAKGAVINPELAMSTVGGRGVGVVALERGRG